VFSSLVAGLATTVYGGFHFNRVAVWSVAANLVAVPLTGLAVMPFALAALLLMPLGLERLALVPMGWGVEAVNRVADAVAGWPAAGLRLPVLPVEGLALFSLGGLWLLLRSRVPFAGLLALVISSALVAGLTSAAYTQQAAEVRADNIRAINQPIGAAVSLLRVEIAALNTALTIEAGTANAAGVVTGEFSGARASRLAVEYAPGDDGSAALTIRETTADGLPLLDDVGRGTLRVTLPAGVPLDLHVSGVDGDAALTLGSLALERLTVAIERGDVVVTLPDYRPQAAAAGDLNGDVTTRSGDLAVLLPAGTAARLELNRGGSGIEPEYDPAAFLYLVGDVLQSTGFETAPFSLRYTLTAPAGRIRVAVAG